LNPIFLFPGLPINFDQGKLQICTPSLIKGHHRRKCRVFDLLADTGQPDLQTAFLMPDALLSELHL
jgi:hypothetical protein